MKKDILVIIPAYNEAKNIGRVIQDISNTYPEYDILVINDGSTDETFQVAKSAGAKVISHPFNVGYGAALQTGYKYALLHNYQYLVQLDADGQHKIEYIGAIINELKSNKVDVIICSRYVSNSMYKTTILKKLGNKIFSFLIFVLTGEKIKDTTSGFQGLNCKILNFYAKDIFPFDYPDADVIISTLRSGYKVKEIPVEMEPSLRSSSIHRGIKPLYYVFKMLFSILVTIFRKPYL